MSNADIAITPPAGASPSLPTNAVTPKEWWIFSIWEPQTDEVGKDFEQPIEVYWPSGEKFVELKVKFKPDERVQYNSTQMLGFPVGQPGKVKILTWVELQGKRITEPFAYYITIKHISQDLYPAGTPHSLAAYSVEK